LNLIFLNFQSSFFIFLFALHAYSLGYTSEKILKNDTKKQHQGLALGKILGALLWAGLSWGGAEEERGRGISVTPEKNFQQTPKNEPRFGTF
jgi:hypothetical protein